MMLGLAVRTTALLFGGTTLFAGGVAAAGGLGVHHGR